MFDVSKDTSSMLHNQVSSGFRSTITTEGFATFHISENETNTPNASLNSLSDQPNNRDGLRSSTGIDALKPYSDVVIPRIPKISPSPIGERAENKISPFQWDSGHTPPRHMENLFGSSDPFAGVLRPTEIELFSKDEGEFEFQFDEPMQSPRKKIPEDEGLFILDEGASDFQNSSLSSSIQDQESQNLQNDAFNNSYGEHPLGEHPSRTLFVRNINSNVEDDELTTLFEQYGPIRSMYTQCKHRGFVMISYFDIRHAKNAMRHLQSKVLRRRKLDIHYSIPKENPSEKDQNQGTLVVFNLDPATTNEELKTIFEVFGEIKEVRETPNKKHHKFIEFYDVRDAENAMKNLNKTEIRSKKIKIEPSRPGGVRKGVNQFSYDQYTEDDEQSFYAPQSLGSDENNSSFMSFTPSNHSYPPPPQNLPKYKSNNPAASSSLASQMSGSYRSIKSPQQQQQQQQQQQMSPHSPGVFPNSPAYPRSPPVEQFTPRTLSPVPNQSPLWGSFNPKPLSPSTSKTFGMSPPQSIFGESKSSIIPKDKSPDLDSNRLKRADSGEDKSRFKLILTKVGSEDMRTTLMIKNIPNKYNQKMLLAAVDDRHKGSYDFFYLPIDFKNKCNVGYAFINFIGYDFIRSFYEEFNDKKWEKFNSEKVCNIAYARIQGKNALVQHFQNSSLMCEDKKCRPIIFHSVGPNMGEQEPFPVGPNLRRRNSDSPNWTSEDEN